MYVTVELKSEMLEKVSSMCGLVARWGDQESSFCFLYKLGLSSVFLFKVLADPGISSKDVSLLLLLLLLL